MTELKNNAKRPNAVASATMPSHCTASIPTAKDARHEWMCRELRISIALQVFGLRYMRGMTQKQFASLVGRHVTVIIKLENPVGEWPSVTTLLDIAAACDCALLVNFEAYSKFLKDIKEWLPPLSFSEEVK